MTDFERTMVDRYFGDALKNLTMRKIDWVAMGRMLSWETYNTLREDYIKRKERC